MIWKTLTIAYHITSSRFIESIRDLYDEVSLNIQILVGLFPSKSRMIFKFIRNCTVLHVFYDNIVLVEESTKEINVKLEEWW